MRTTRRPPMPPRVPRGHCTWCAEPVLFPVGHKRAGELQASRSWHHDCARAYKLAAWGAEQRARCWERDAGKCAACGVLAVRVRWARQGTYCGIGQKGDLYDVSYVLPVRDDRWDADHIRPLWSAPRDMTLDQRPAWFGLENLQTLCRQCHKAKTAREARHRADARRPVAPLRADLFMATPAPASAAQGAML